MTTDRRRGLRAPVLAAAVMALLVWFGGLIAVTAAAAPAGDYWAIGPRPALFAALASADALLIREQGAGLIVRGGGAAMVRALYAHGAWLVLPASAGGCLGLRRAALAGN